MDRLSSSARRNFVDMPLLVYCLLSLASAAAAFSCSSLRPAAAVRSGGISMQHSKGWDGFGKGPFKFYGSFDEFMAPFPDEDREAYPEMFRLPDGVYEVALPRPLGIAFEENVAEMPMGICVDYCVEGGNAAASGVIKPGDKLIAVTACKVFQARWERKLLPCDKMDFDIIMSAIASNEPRWNANDVVMQFMRPGEGDEAKVVEHLKFFQIPSDHVFRVG